MPRQCPKCGANCISSLQIGLFLRPRCSTCGAKVGLHWLVGTAILLVGSVAAPVVLLILLPFNVRILTLLGTLTTLMVIFLVVGKFGPVEEKVKWWEP